MSTEDARTVVVGGFGPGIRIKGNGTVKIVTSKRIVTIPVKDTTVVVRPTVLKPVA